VDDRIERAGQLYEQAVFGGEVTILAEADRHLDAVEADYCLARGRIIHTRFLLRQDQDPGQAIGDPGELWLFERAAQLYRTLGDVPGEAEALFWIGCFYQVVQHDDAMAAPALEQSLELGSRAGDKQTMSEALRHLGIASHHAGQLDAARQHLEESTRLRREIGLLPGVAANLIGLAYIAVAQDRQDDARALLDEAAAIAQTHAAERILRSANEARAELWPRS
jgi:tetratricopeptide (TPR) repeat protein